jgi:predicted ATPase with chaperone activity
MSNQDVINRNIKELPYYGSGIGQKIDESYEAELRVSNQFSPRYADHSWSVAEKKIEAKNQQDAQRRLEKQKEIARTVEEARVAHQQAEFRKWASIVTPQLEDEKISWLIAHPSEDEDWWEEKIMPLVISQLITQAKKDAHERSYQEYIQKNEFSL